MMFFMILSIIYMIVALFAHKHKKDSLKLLGFLLKIFLFITCEIFKFLNNTIFRKPDKVY